MIEGLTQEQAKALETAEKLFRLAGKNPNKNEAASASAKAMEILANLNLDISVLEQGGAEKAKRSDEKMAGGLYKWQRDLWEAIAELHFCFYWNQYTYDHEKVNRYQSRKRGRRVMGGYRFEHRVVGRKVNVIAVKNMAGYLEQTIERLTREHVVSPSNYFTRYATSFRSGVADEVIGKIYARRDKLLAEEQKKKREAEERANKAGMSGASTSRELTVADVKESEHAANYDFLYGEGAWARELKYRQDLAEAQRKAEEDYARWAAANPEEARKEEEERRKRRRRRPWNYGMGSEKDNTDWGGYTAGRDAGKGVGIDPQAGGAGEVRRIR